MRILSLSGGGIRGIIQATILENIEKYTGRPIMDDFDLVIGTSTGGIIATGLTHPKKFKCQDISKLYLENGKKIFSGSSNKSVKNLWGWLDNSYSNEGIISVLKGLYGDSSLNDHYKRTLVTVFELNSYSATVMDSGIHSNYYSWEAAVATASAPSYFEPLKVGNESFIDGGVCGLANPSGWISARVISEGFKPEDLKLLNIGTGSVVKSIKHEDACKWGKAEWLKPVIDMQMQGSLGISGDILDCLVPNSLVLNPRITKELSAMDKDVNIPQLRDLANEYFKRNKQIITNFIDTLSER